MKLWIEIILEWLNCLDVLETRIKDLKELDDGKLYKKLIELFSWQGIKDNSEAQNIVVKFLEDEYPEYKLEHKDVAEMEHVYIASLFLLHVSQEPIFYRPMCVKLQHETQLKIKTFLEMVIPHGKNVNRQMLKEIITELQNDIPQTPITPKTRTLKDFFNSPAARSAQSYKLLSERCKELRNLKTELEVERFEKADLQEDLRIQQNKVQNLQKKLQEKSAEIKALRDEKMKPKTPQSCKKNRDTREYERHYKKEIDRLEDQLLQKQCEIDKLEEDNDTLTKKLTCMGKQYVYFKEKLENSERTLEHVQVQGEIKDRELVNLRMTNEELRTHLKELSKIPTEEQSFEIDGIAPLNSPSTSFNGSEALSSVIDIQLQEAKTESASLKIQLDVTNKKLESLSVEYENTMQLLNDKTQMLQEKETQLNETLNKLMGKIQELEKEKQSIINENKNLEALCASQKESLSQAEESNNVLSMEISTMKEEAKNLQECLHNKNMNNTKLNDELIQVKSQIHENLKYIQDITVQNNSYKTSADLYNKNLKEIILHNSETNCADSNKLDNKTTTQLIEHVQIILCNLNKEFSLKETELQSLKNAVEEAKLELETFQSKISQSEERDRQNVTEITNLQQTIAQDTIKIKQYSEEISYLKQVELEKQILEKDLSLYKEEVNKKDLLLQASKICIQTLKQKIQTLVSDYYSIKKDILNQINEYQKYSTETNRNYLNAHNILFANYTEERYRKNELEKELSDNKQKLTHVRNVNSTLENDLMKNKKVVNNLEAELISMREELEDYVQKLKKLEETKEKCEKQCQSLKFENEKVQLDLNNANDKLKHTQQEIFNMTNQLKFKDERIENLIAEISSLKLEKEHIVHLKMGGETEMKNFIKELETELLTKQRQVDQLNINVKLKQETLELVQDKFEKLSKETIASEMKLKEVIMNLQEVRTNQDAVLKAQEKALKEKCAQLEQLQSEFSESKATFSKQFEEEKLRCQNLQSTNSELQIQSYKQTKTIEELQEILKKERNELNKNKEYCKVEDTKKMEIVQICEKLEYSINDLKSTIADTCTENENFYSDVVINDVPCINENDKIENISKTIRTSINEIHASRKLILHLSNVNANLNETIQNQKVIVDNYVAKCEEVKLLKTKMQELSNMEEQNMEQMNTLIKRKQSLKNCLENIMKSREDLDTSLHELQQKWDRLVSKSHSTFMMDKSLCDELKHIQVKKTDLENTLVKHCARHFQNIKPLQNILLGKFLWSEQILKNTYLNATKKGQILDTSLDTFSDEKTVIESELNKNIILQKDITKLENEVDDFSDLVTSFETNIKSNQIQLQSEVEKKLQLEISELNENKNDLESKLNCARIKNAKLEEDFRELKIEVQDVKATSLKEVEDLKKELTQLEAENSKIQEERNELRKRPKKEDVDKQLKDIHDKYKVKLDEIKQNMKTAYNEQITKLNREQEQSIQERLESLQRKMELQCRKQADELSKYKAHVAGMSSQIWNVGEKLLSERQEKEKLQKELVELKAKYQNLDHKMISSVEHKSSKYEKRDLLRDNKEVLHKVAVIQEKTTYERRCSIRSIQTMGNAFNAEDEEGEVFDNIYLADMKDGNSSCSTDTDRLSILKKRNALCKPHLKSSYPAEMQFHPLPFTEEEIKAGSTADDIFNDSLSQSLLPEQKAKKKDRTQTSYKKPGPPTPSKNGGRLSLQGNELKSPNSRILKERNKDRATTTPRTLKSLFISRRQDENAAVTPRGRRRSSIFRKHRGANDR